MYTVYRFKRKIGSNWTYVTDKQGVPLSITTSKPRQSVLHIFKYRYPSIAAMYRLGETLIAEPDMEATKKREEFQRKMKEAEEEKIRNRWDRDY